MSFIKARRTKHWFGITFGYHYPRLAKLALFISLSFRKPYLFLANLFTELGVLCLKCKVFLLKCENRCLKIEESRLDITD